MNGSSDEEYEETPFCFVSTEQKVDEAKEVLDKANFCPMPAMWEFSFAFVTASLYDLVFTCQRQGNKSTASISFSFNGLHLLTFIGTEL